ncbi:ribosome-associated ATPase/putative transporter RbbA [Rhodoplanes sp. TEM]|uniref:Ribosome-associated ATPase/putative transporter RbbA n=1 Tax=Rhodoplanes tepidamans TaxID=200616 RepID=A0ABT5JHJ4_RHOTP|nr:MULTISPECIES: ribosome-associated ATPase/putative transporter RbbA [Rhodoplanes]MDC7789057.1 ribosome-associated ATPase/putative transporter RbbA [Rhodoplanes tepidamans]MDC7982488.1 ribosome-associated ATPase/putative transporter RbbA [Rhodoplanes sp. TEM]MDQ0354940.1 ribosome-dependent ATPase [Rhodoplanes tepidamans]
MTGDCVARLDGVSHRYGTVDALADVTLDIPAGRMVGVIGPDGVGKSTLLALLAGVRRIQSGTVTVLDGDMADAVHRRTSCARIAYMPQGLGRNLYPTLSVFENVDFFGRLFGQSEAERRTRIADLTRATGLDPFVGRPAGKLSGGMKQKLSLCCALMHDPDLLVLDEPTTGVDPLSRRQFWELIDTIRARRPQMSVLVATAYMEEAARFDWLAAMDDGREIAHGAPAEILARADETSLERAFIALLPAEKRARHAPVVVRPRVAAADETPAIEAEGLTRRFGDFVAVDHVSFRIGRGEIFGFLGSNGCGKTTTMKMLTGLLPASDGRAELFGAPIGAGDVGLRRNVGYMSQAFSLYAELTVRQNLDLHARLYHLPRAEVAPRIAELLARYDLEAVADQRPDALPLGIKQRLQLAVAVLHRPPLLILDEPTSGVDPIARDAFWRTLIDLSRDEGVTIFLSTHFMNEAERCDRISLMHAGRVLAVGTPAELAAARGGGSLEEAFVAYLAEAGGVGAVPAETESAVPATPAGVASAEAPAAVPKRFDPGRLWAYARREAMELLRDPIRLVFALVGPIVLMMAFGWGISFDVENLKWAAFDQDRTPESRALLESFSGSRYFTERPPVSSTAELDDRMRRGELALVVEIPPGFGRDLQNGRVPEVGVWIDGAMPFRGETTRSYVGGLALQYAQQRAIERAGPNASASTLDVEVRYRYNQAFKSVVAMVPSIIALMLILIPAVMSAVAVVREKETGSIANFRATPTGKVEFLVGKQLPYVAVAMASFATLMILAVTLFGVPVTGSFAALALGTLLYCFATTGFGQLVSTFTRTQVAAVFATAILAVVPAVNFSGLLVPVASLSGGARVLGLAFPAAWYQPISVGTFAKALGFSAVWPQMVVLAVFSVAYLIAARTFLQKQER